MFLLYRFYTGYRDQRIVDENLKNAIDRIDALNILNERQCRENGQFYQKVNELERSLKNANSKIVFWEEVVRQRAQPSHTYSESEKYATIKSVSDRLAKDYQVLNTRLKALTNDNTIAKANLLSATNQIKLLETKVLNQRNEIKKLQTVRDQEKQDFLKLKIEYDNINRLNNAKDHEELENIAMVNARLLHEIEVLTQAGENNECSVCFEPVSINVSNERHIY